MYCVSEKEFLGDRAREKVGNANKRGRRREAVKADRYLAR